MKRVIFYALMIPVLVGMISCSSSKKMDVQQLAGRWNITEVNGNKVTKTEKVPFIEFNISDNKVHGNAGCNMFNTVIVRNDKDNSAFTFRQAASTMMACPDMELEGEILKAIESVTGVKAGNSDNEAFLVNSAGNKLLVLSK